MAFVLLGILAALAAPRYADVLARQRLDAAARRVESDLNLVRRLARVSGADKTIQFDVSGGRYEIQGVADPDRSGQPYVVRMLREPYGAAIVSADFGGAPTLTFDGFGVPTADGSVVLRVGRFQRTITIGDNVAVELQLPPTEES